MGSIAPLPGTTETITASNSTGRIAFSGAGGSQLRVWNSSSSVTAFIELGDATVEATTEDFPLGPNQEVILEVGGQTNLAAITASSTAALYLTPVHVHAGS